MIGIILLSLILGLLALIGGRFNIRILLDLFTINNPIEHFFGNKGRRIYCIIFGIVLIVLSVLGYIDIIIES